ATNGGQRGSPPAITASSDSGSIVNGAQPVARPDGTVVVVFSAFDGLLDPDHNAILAARSTDGGRTFGAVTRISPLYEEDVRGMRAPPMPSTAVDRSGTITVAWSACRFLPAFPRTHLLLTPSRTD